MVTTLSRKCLPSVLHGRQDSAECCVSGGDGKVSLVEVRSQL